MVTALIAALIVVAGAAYWLQLRRSKSSVPEKRPTKTLGRFGAVEIRLRSGACEAACALEGQRFLASEAPALPLPKCTAAKCSCAFAKHTDRRSDDRRFEHGGLGASMFQSANRRAKRDRRSEEEQPKRR
jgi:hypothetical protein